jgi:hypothetical protein
MQSKHQILPPSALSVTTIVFWLVLLLVYVGRPGSPAKAAIVLITGTLSFPLFVASLALAIVKRDEPAWRIAALINATPMFAVLIVWIWVLLFSDP